MPWASIRSAASPPSTAAWSTVNGYDIVNGATNTMAIYTAAEIAFNTQVGETYTIQGITALTGNWQNISTNIPGTGTAISYLTPTRGNPADVLPRGSHPVITG